MANGAHAEWRATIWDQSKLAQALRGEVLLSDGSRSSKMKWSSKLWGIPHMNIALIKADPMHVLFVDGVVNKVMGVLLFQICVARHDLPGKTIEERVAKAWCDIQSHYHPYAPPIKGAEGEDFPARRW